MKHKKPPQQNKQNPYEFFYNSYREIKEETIEIKKDTEQILKSIFSLQVGLIKIETGQNYLIWIMGLCFTLTISIGLGTLWKLFDIIKIISITN